jgi:TrpR-related protein YerC/YecD
MSGIKNRDFTFNQDSNALFEGILSLQNTQECEQFFRDVLTLSELQAMTERFTVARKLNAKNQSYRSINEETGVSTATITRVAQWMKDGMGEYRLVLDRLHHHFKNVSRAASAL